MIIFNNLGHTFKPATDSSPIVWVDSSDASTYTLSGSDVLTLDNKGTLGGAMTLNGTVKFANNGFESWSGSDYITRGLGEPFLPTNSFTVVTTFDLQDIFGSPSYPPNDDQFISELLADNSNRTAVGHFGTSINSIAISNSSQSSNLDLLTIGLKTTIISYDLNTNTISSINSVGNNMIFTSRTFNNTIDCEVNLLNSGIYPKTLGADNPLHEFRLYDRAFTLTQMQTFQTELNNKYTP